MDRNRQKQTESEGGTGDKVQEKKNKKCKGWDTQHIHKSHHTYISTDRKRKKIIIMSHVSLITHL